MPFVYTDLGQRVTVVLAALHEIGRVSTKAQTIAFIEKMSWLNLQQEDFKSFPTHPYEAIWHTNIAFARQYAFDHGLITDRQERDEWVISDIGRERLASVREKFRIGVYNVAQGHLWSLAFKRWLRPDYKPSATDVFEFI